MSKLDQDRQRRGTVYEEELPGVTKDWQWSGFSRNFNRRATPPNYFYTAENVRLEQGDVSSRRGIAAINTADSESSTCVLGMTSQSSLNVNGRLVICLGDYIYLYQPSFNKNTVYDLNPDTVDGTPLGGGTFVTKHNGALWTKDGRKLTLKTEANGTISAALSSVQIDPTANLNLLSFPTPVNTLEDSSTNLTIDRSGLNDLWWVNSSTAYRFNDVAIIADGPNLTTGFLIGALNEQVFVCSSPIVETTSTGFYVRGFDGTWSAVTAPTYSLEPGDTTSEFWPLGWTYYKGKAILHGYYTATGATGTWFGATLVWDGSSLTEGTMTGQVGSSESSPAGIMDATVFGGNYYYTYTVESPSQASWIGKYDNSSWSDTFIDTTAITSTANHYPTAIGAVGDYLVFVGDATDANGQEFWRSSDLSTWTELTVSSGSTMSDGNTADFSLTNTSLV